MVCFKFLHPKFSNNTNKHKLKSNLQKLEFSKHLVQIAWGLTFGAVGSARALGARGQQFEPANPDQVTCSYDLCMSVFIFLDKT